MIDPSPMVGAMMKRLGENCADFISKRGTWTKACSQSDQLSSLQKELAALQRENEQLKAYVFLVLQLLADRVNKIETEGEPDAE